MKKRFIFPLLFLLLIGSYVATAYTFRMTMKETGETAQMGELPTLSFRKNDTEINRAVPSVGDAVRLTAEMNALPVKPGEEVRMKLSNDRLRDVHWYILNGDRKEVATGSFAETLKMPGNLDNGREYYLKIQGVYRGMPVTYLNRLYVGKTLYQEHLKFCEEMSENLRKNENMSNYTSYITPVTTQENDLSVVTPESGLYNMTYQNLHPEREETKPARVVEVNSFMTSVVLESLMSDESGGVRHYYKVREFFRVRSGGDAMRLLDYQRTMTQYLEPTESKVEFSAGVQPHDIPIITMGTRSLFSVNRELWLFNTKGPLLRRVFAVGNTPAEAFMADDSFRVMPIMATESGDVDFAVIGRMPLGDLEGHQGIAYLRYRALSNDIKMLAFVDIDMPFSLLRNAIGDFVRMDNQGALIFTLDNRLYKVDAADGAKVERENFRKGDYISTPDGTKLAYRTEGGLKIFYTDLQAELNVKAPDAKHDLIPVVFWENGDLAYSEKNRDTGKIDRICIINTRNEIIRTYTSDQYDITDAKDNGNSVEIKRADKKTGEPVASDYLLYVAKDGQRVSTVVDMDPKRGRIRCIRPEDDAMMQGLKVETSMNLLTGEHPLMQTLHFDKPLYCRYQYGELVEASEDFNALVQKAAEQGGLVRNADGLAVWQKQLTMDDLSVKDFPLANAKDAGDSGKACVIALEQYFGMEDAYDESKSPEDNVRAIFKDRAVDIHGLSLEDALYYSQIGVPAMVKSEGRFVILLGTHAGTIVMMDPTKGSREAVLMIGADREKVESGFAVFR